MKRFNQFLIVMVIILFIMGCKENPVPYVPPEPCLDPVVMAGSQIMKITNNDPRTLGKIIKTRTWAALIASPEHVADSLKILIEANQMLEGEGLSYLSLFAYLNAEFNLLDVKYMAPLVVWMPGFEGVMIMPEIINACDKALIQKNLSELQAIIETL